MLEINACLKPAWQSIPSQKVREGTKSLSDTKQSLKRETTATWGANSHMHYKVS